MSTIFLETSMQIERTLTMGPESSKIESIIESSKHQFISSNYVWMEYQRSFVSDYAHIHRVMGQQKGWAEFFWHLLEGPRAFRPRSAVRCTKIIGDVYGECEGDYGLAYEIIGYHLEYRLPYLFWRNVSRQPDTIRCDLVTSGIALQPDNSFSVPDSCRKDTAACHLPEFLAQNQHRLQTLSGYLATHKQAIKDQARVQKVLSAVLENPRAALGQNACWPLGDIIIALQVPDDAQIWTLDADFEVLSTAMGLTVYQPT
ncbi:MAG: hypothetical protein AAF639_18850 [Chloroflexota bacterium]